MRPVTSGSMQEGKQQLRAIHLTAMAMRHASRSSLFRSFCQPGATEPTVVGVAGRIIRWAVKIQIDLMAIVILGALAVLTYGSHAGGLRMCCRFECVAARRLVSSAFLTFGVGVSVPVR